MHGYELIIIAEYICTKLIGIAMPKTKTPVVKRVENKLRRMIEAKASISQSAEYICATIRSFKDSRRKILDMAESINPLIASKAIILDNAITKKRLEKVADEVEIQNLAKTQKDISEKNRLDALKAEYEIFKSSGNEKRWGVALDTGDRKHFFKPKEIKEIVTLRREKLSTYKTRILIGCSLAEINRWDKEGLLPHAFKQVIQIGGKSKEARFWLESEVKAKMLEIGDWRKSYELKKSFKRKNSPLKLV